MFTFESQLFLQCIVLYLFALISISILEGEPGVVGTLGDHFNNRFVTLLEQKNDKWKSVQGKKFLSNPIELKIVTSVVNFNFFAKISRGNYEKSLFFDFLFKKY